LTGFRIPERSSLLRTSAKLAPILALETVSLAFYVVVVDLFNFSVTVAKLQFRFPQTGRMK
jgi:hypothetical protein